MKWLLYIADIKVRGKFDFCTLTSDLFEQGVIGVKRKAG